MHGLLHTEQSLMLGSRLFMSEGRVPAGSGHAPMVLAHAVRHLRHRPGDGGAQHRGVHLVVAYLLEVSGVYLEVASVYLVWSRMALAIHPRVACHSGIVDLPLVVPLLR